MEYKLRKKNGVRFVEYASFVVVVVVKLKLSMWLSKVKKEIDEIGNPKPIIIKEATSMVVMSDKQFTEVINRIEDNNKLFRRVLGEVVDLKTKRKSSRNGKKVKK